MTNFLLGFGLAAGIAVAWHFGLVKPRLDALKQQIADKLAGKP